MSERMHVFRVPAWIIDMSEDHNHPGWLAICVFLALLSGILL